MADALLPSDASSGGSTDERRQLLQWFLAARRQIEIGRRDRAHELLAECLAMEPDNLLVARLFVENWQALAEGLPAETGRRRGYWFRRPTLRRVATQLLKRPHDLGLLDEFVRALQQAAPPEVLAEILPVICHAMPRSERSWRVLAEIMTELGRCEEALECWRAVMSEQPLEREDATVVAGLESIVAVQPDASGDDLAAAEAQVRNWARRAVTAAVAAEESGSRVLARLAARLEEHYRHVAIDVYRGLVERHPTRVDLRRKLAHFLYRTGDLRAVEIAIESAPGEVTDPQLLAVLAEVRQRQRRFDEALELYRRALGADEPGSGDHEWRCRILRQAAKMAGAMGQTELCQRWIEEAAACENVPD